jgi:hypothetical protein
VFTIPSVQILFSQTALSLRVLSVSTKGLDVDRYPSEPLELTHHYHKYNKLTHASGRASRKINTTIVVLFLLKSSMEERKRIPGSPYQPISRKKAILSLLKHPDHEFNVYCTATGVRTYHQVGTIIQKTTVPVPGVDVDSSPGGMLNFESKGIPHCVAFEKNASINDISIIDGRVKNTFKHMDLDCIAASAIDKHSFVTFIIYDDEKASKWSEHYTSDALLFTSTQGCRHASSVHIAGAAYAVYPVRRAL